MNDDLPAFKERPLAQVLPFARKIFGESLLELVPYDDGHFRALFKVSYFVLQEDKTQATKSQWNSLKKRMKRHNRTVFIFREHGEIDCIQFEDADSICYFIDFGFFVEP